MKSVSKKYQNILITGNASELHTLSKDVRRNAMRALTHLAKYNGRYEEWQKIIKQNGLKWKQADDNFNFFTNENITEMLQYVKQIIKTYPGDCSNTFIFATLIGLRANEVCQAIGLIKQDAKDYYNHDHNVLEHFRYKEIFIRRSKKAYISIVDDELVKLAKHSCDSWEAIRSKIKRENMDMHMSYCRKIFSTYLRMNGVESELIDLLQGRIPNSVFARHYFRPDFNKETERIRKLLTKLHKEIVEG